MVIDRNSLPKPNCYKCVRVHESDNRLMSYLAVTETVRGQFSQKDARWRTLAVEYKLYKTVFPKVGKLFVFKSFDDVKWFCGHDNNMYRIYHSYGTDLKECIGILFPDRVNTVRLSWFWNNQRRLSDIDVMLPPTGTFTATSVMLIDRVYYV